MTPELAAARVGKVTASRISDVLSGGKGITRQKYMAQLAIERISGSPSRIGFFSKSITHGAETEPFARMEYEIRNGVLVLESDFIDHPFIANSGCSPDGLVDDDGLIEIKCTDSHTFVDFALTKIIPEKYRLQMLWQICVTRRTWCDMVFYEPELPNEDNLIQVRYTPSQKDISDLESEIRKFNTEVDVVKQNIIALRDK